MHQYQRQLSFCPIYISKILIDQIWFRLVVSFTQPLTALIKLFNLKINIRIPPVAKYKSQHIKATNQYIKVYIRFITWCPRCQLILESKSIGRRFQPFCYHFICLYIYIYIYIYITINRHFQIIKNRMSLRNMGVGLVRRLGF
jgi:hypothetical protein